MGCTILLVAYGAIAVARYHESHRFLVLRGLMCLYAALGIALSRKLTRGIGRTYTLGVAIFGFILLAGRITTGVSYDIREAAFNKLQELPFSFYDRKAVGWLMSSNR